MSSSSTNQTALLSSIGKKFIGNVAPNKVLYCICKFIAISFNFFLCCLRPPNFDTSDQIPVVKSLNIDHWISSVGDQSLIVKLPNVGLRVIFGGLTTIGYHYIWWFWDFEYYIWNFFIFKSKKNCQNRRTSMLFQQYSNCITYCNCNLIKCLCYSYLCKSNVFGDVCHHYFVIFKKITYLCF